MTVKASFFLEPEKIDNLQALVGVENENLYAIEDEVGVEIGGNNFRIELLGDTEKQVNLAKNIILDLYQQTFNGKKVHDITPKEVYLTIHEWKARQSLEDEKAVKAFEEAQRQYQEQRKQEQEFEAEQFELLAQLQQKLVEQQLREQAAQEQQLREQAAKEQQALQAHAQQAPQAKAQQVKLPPAVLEAIAKAKAQLADKDNQEQTSQTLTPKRNYWEYEDDEVVPLQGKYKEDFFGDFDNLFSPQAEKVIPAAQDLSDVDLFSMPTFDPSKVDLFADAQANVYQPKADEPASYTDANSYQSAQVNQEGATTRAQALELLEEFNQTHSLRQRAIDQAIALAEQEEIEEFNQEAEDLQLEQMAAKEKLDPKQLKQLLINQAARKAAKEHAADVGLTDIASQVNQVFSQGSLEQIYSLFADVEPLTDEDTQLDLLLKSSRFAQKTLSAGDLYYLFTTDFKVPEWYLEQFDSTEEEQEKFASEIANLLEYFDDRGLELTQKAIEFMAYSKFRYLMAIEQLDWSDGLPDTYLDIAYSGDLSQNDEQAVEFSIFMQQYERVLKHLFVVEDELASLDREVAQELRQEKPANKVDTQYADPVDQVKENSFKAPTQANANVYNEEQLLERVSQLQAESEFTNTLNGKVFSVEEIAKLRQAEEQGQLGKVNFANSVHSVPVGNQAQATSQVQVGNQVQATQTFANQSVANAGAQEVKATAQVAGDASVFSPTPSVMVANTVSRNQRLQEQERLRHNGSFMQINPKIRCKSVNQHLFAQGILANDITFGVGPAGSGKTLVAVAMALKLLAEHKVERLVLTRPAVEAGENLGFLPGTLQEKLDPYLRPLFDAIIDILGPMQAEKLLTSKVVEIAPLAFMRGRTLSNAFVILDEAQNTSVAQMKMMVTRLGLGSKMVITGDKTQSDLPRNQASGLDHAMRVLDNVPNVRFYSMDKGDVVRHSTVSAIIDAYDEYEMLHPEVPRERGRKENPLQTILTEVK
ncbi:PhoH family protein [Psittacicella hinzii]|nr:PhoH family protein [Psittacicella hinzii]